MDEVKIRPYEAKDKEALTDICKETAWESYKKDPQKLATVPINFLDYFLEYEPSHVLVAAEFRRSERSATSNARPLIRVS
jgi:hypothetical protein